MSLEEEGRCRGERRIGEGARPLSPDDASRTSTSWQVSRVRDHEAGT